MFSATNSKGSPRLDRLALRKNCTDKGGIPPRIVARQASNMSILDTKPQDSGARQASPAPRRSMSPVAVRCARSPMRPERPRFCGVLDSPSSSPSIANRSTASVKASPVKPTKPRKISLTPQRSGSKEQVHEDCKKNFVNSVVRRNSGGYPARSAVNEPQKRHAAAAAARAASPWLAAPPATRCSSPSPLLREVDHSTEGCRAPGTVSMANLSTANLTRAYSEKYISYTPSVVAVPPSVKQQEDAYSEKYLSYTPSVVVIPPSVKQQEDEVRLAGVPCETDGATTPWMTESALERSQTLLDAMKQMGLGDDMDNIAQAMDRQWSHSYEADGDIGSPISPRSPPSFVREMVAERTVDTSEVPTALMKVLGEMWIELKELRAKQDTQELRSKLEAKDSRPEAPLSTMQRCASVSSTAYPTSGSGLSVSTCMTGIASDRITTLRSDASDRCASPMSSPLMASRMMSDRAPTPQWQTNFGVVRQNSVSVLSTTSPCRPQVMTAYPASPMRNAMSPLRSPVSSPQHSMPRTIASPLAPVSPLHCRLASPMGRVNSKASLVAQTVTISSLYRLHQ